jgi:acetyl esterase/lipase
MTVIGSGPKSYTLFEPTDPAPTERVPVIVFLHGWMGINPAFYGAWIEHLGRRGAAVIFPRYQNDMGTGPADFLPNTVASVRDALDVLETGPGRVRPDRDRFALIGHSAGGNLAALLAASVDEAELPRPRAVVAVMPGEVAHQTRPSLGDIPAHTLLLVIAGDLDFVVGDHRAREIFEQASAIPCERKKYLLYRTDRSGPIPVVADHLAPTCAQPRFDTGEGLLRASQMASAQVDLLDRSGFWRAADLTLHAAFTGQTLDAVSRQGALFCDLGRFSSGRVVLPPLCGDRLDEIPRVALPHGARLGPAPPLREAKDQ